MLSAENRIFELVRLWTEPDSDSVRRIVGLCGELEREASNLEAVDPRLLRRLEHLASAAPRRLAACVCLDARTGGYSRGGDQETLNSLSTVGWEG